MPHLCTPFERESVMAKLMKAQNDVALQVRFFFAG